MSWVQGGRFRALRAKSGQGTVFFKRASFLFNYCFLKRTTAGPTTYPGIVSPDFSLRFLLTPWRPWSVRTQRQWAEWVEDGGAEVLGPDSDCHTRWGPGQLSLSKILFFPLFKKIYWFERERKTPVCFSTSLCTHWLVLVGALTEDQTHSLGSKQLNYMAGALFLTLLNTNKKVKGFSHSWLRKHSRCFKYLVLLVILSHKVQYFSFWGEGK